jgi:hypothetical protein
MRSFKATNYIKILSLFLMVLLAACTREQASVEGCWQYLDASDRLIKIGVDSMWTYLPELPSKSYKVWTSNNPCDQVDSLSSSEALYFYVEYIDKDSFKRNQCYEIHNLSSKAFSLVENNDTTTFTSIPCDSIGSWHR